MSSSIDPTQCAFAVRRACWTQDRDALTQVRTRVFVKEQGVPPALEWDQSDETAIHLLAWDGADHPIGTARLLPSGQIGRMAVLGPWRGRGVGSALLREALRIAAESGLPTPFLHAQTAALSFYHRHGFRAAGQVFYEAGIPHRTMIHGGEP
jgi:predicted GNAT family N-acyltransferase